MNKKLGIGIVVVIAIVTVAMFAGCIEEEKAPVATPTPSPVVTPTPTPPLETVSDKAEKMKIQMYLQDLRFSTMYKFAFHDEKGRYIPKFEDGKTIIKIETFNLTERKWAKIRYNKIDKIIEIEEIDAGQSLDAKFYYPKHTKPPTGSLKWDYINVTVTLPNGKVVSTHIEYKNWSLLVNEVIEHSKDNEYYEGYQKGAKDARMGYSAKIPKGCGEYCRDGYFDGYIGATPRYTLYRYSPISKTITIE